MTDFDYEVMQKKRIARGAAHMKRGSKSKKCSLPSDHMTPAEWKRRNGPVSTYKLDAPMSWDEFRAMPEDLQCKYLNNLFELYGATAEMMAEMFGVTRLTVNRRRADLGIAPGKHTGKLSNKAKAERAAKWTAFCNGVVGGGDSVTEPESCEEVQETPAEAVEEVKETPEVEEVMEGFKTWSESIPTELPRELMMKRAQEAVKPDPLTLDYLTAVFSGEFEPEKFLHWIAKLPMPDSKVRIKVEVAAL